MCAQPQVEGPAQSELRELRESRECHLRPSLLSRLGTQIIIRVACGRQTKGVDKDGGKKHVIRYMVRACVCEVKWEK